MSHRRISLMFIIACLVRATQGQCREKLTAAAALGETAEFTICQSTPSVDIIGFRSLTSTSNVNVPRENLTDGWYWKTSGSGADSAIPVSLTPDSAEDYDTYTVAFTNTAGVYMGQLTVSHQGPPQLCETEEPSSVHTLSAAIGSSNSSTLCVVSGSELTLSKVQPQTCQGRKTDTPTFNVTAVQNMGNPVVYELEFSVSSLTVADFGQWTVNVKNDDGSLTIEVNVEAVGPPTVCDASQDLNLYLECDASKTSVFIFSQDVLEWEIDELASVEISSCTSPLGVSIEAKDATSLTQELVVTATCDEASTWNVTVGNSYGDLEINVTVGNCTIPESTTTATAETDDDDSILYIIIGCVVGGLAITIAATIYCIYHLLASKKSKSPSKKSRKEGEEQIAYDTEELKPLNARDSEEIAINNNGHSKVSTPNTDNEDRDSRRAHALCGAVTSPHRDLKRPVGDKGPPPSPLLE